MKQRIKRLCEAMGVGGVGDIAEVIARDIAPFVDTVEIDALDRHPSLSKPRGTDTASGSAYG